MAFSIKQLLFWMAVLAFGLVATLSQDNALLGRLFELATLGILVGMVYRVWLSTGESRVFGVGFLCWAVVYFLLFKKIFDVGIADLVSRAYRELNDRAWGAGGTPPQGIIYPEPPVFSERGLGDYLYPNVHASSHSLLLLLLGLVGGWVTVFFYRKRQRMLAQQT